MRKTKLLSVLLAVLMVLSVIPFTVVSASEVIEIDGERVAFVSSFGKMSYEGKSYQTYKTFMEAFNALGKEGGKIIFTGKIALPDFKDIPGRAPITIEGIGTKATGNLLDFSGTAEAPVTELNLEGDLILNFLNMRLAKDAYLFTNGHAFETINGFDTYNVTKRETIDGTVHNVVYYEDPMSIAPGTITDDAIIYLNAGTYNILAGGAVNGKTVSGDTYVTLDGGTVDTVVGANVDGTMNGNATLIIGNGNINKLVAGSAAGTVNGNVSVTIGGGEIAEAVIGAEAGATINGNVVVALNGGNFGGTIGAGTGKVTGKKIVIAGVDATLNLANDAADVVIKMEGGFCEPQFEGSSLKGYLLTDEYGIPVLTANINGKDVTSENGIYQLSDGTNTVKVATLIDVKVNKNATYVAGYEDGTFKPQNNITRAEAMTLLTRVVTDDKNVNGKISANYKDVEAGTWYEAYIGFFQKLGYLDTIAGDHGAKMMPTQNITRGEFTELIYKISALGDSPSSMKLISFSDVTDKYPYAVAISYAVGSEVVNGYEDGTFKPDNNITRAEAVTMVNRFLGRVPNGAEGTATFSDIDSHWAKSQILAACGTENTTWTAQAEKPKYVLTGTNAEEYIKALYDQSKNLDATAIREGVDVIAEQMKKDILNTPNTMEIYGDKIDPKSCYYVSEKNGNDDNDGKTPETAVKTIAGISSKLRFPKKGTAILFERGGIYRGQIGVTNGVIYGAYGEGPKPLIMQSRKNYADPSLWEKTEWENVWKLKEELINVGIIGFDHDLFDYSEDTYNELYGLIMNKDTRGFDGPEELCGDLQFYSELNGSTTKAGPLYVYSTKGNPGERFTSIEMGEKIDVFDGNPTGCTIDNIAVKFTGGHGVGFGTSSDVTVTNCVFSWLGGSVLKFNTNLTAVNYGNAVEIYGGCDNYNVINNWMYQIYDTAVTHQRSSATGNCIQKNVNYLNNLMEYVFWGIEFYNAPPTADQLGGGKDIYTRITENVRSAYNILRLGGYGWGSITRYRGARLYCGSTLSTNRNCIAEYNIFDRAQGSLLALPSNSTEVEDKNIYIQTIGQSLGTLKGLNTTCTVNAANDIANLWGDKNAVVVVIDNTKEPVVLNKPEGLAPATLD